MQTKDKDTCYVSRQIPASIIYKWEVNTWLFWSKLWPDNSNKLLRTGSKRLKGQKINVMLKQHSFGTVEHAVILTHSCSKVIYSEKLQEMCLSTDSEYNIEIF